MLLEAGVGRGVVGYHSLWKFLILQRFDCKVELDENWGFSKVLKLVNKPFAQVELCATLHNTNGYKTPCSNWREGVGQRPDHHGKPWESKGHGLKQPGIWRVPSQNLSSSNTQNQALPRVAFKTIEYIKSSPLPVLANNILWENSNAVHLSTVYGCFHTTRTELSSHGQDLNVHFLFLSRKSLPVCPKYF